MDRINCSKTFESSKWILSKSGLWVTKTITNWAVIKLILNIIFDATVFTVLCCNIMNAIQRRNVTLLNRMVCILIPTVNYMAKTVTLMINKKCFWSILSDLDSRVFNSHNEVLNRHIQSIHRLSKLLLRYFTLALTVYIIIGSILPMVVNIGLIVPAPFNTGRYDFVYKIAHLFGTIYLAFNTVGFDMLFLTLLSLCVAQLSILESQLETIEKIAPKYGNRGCANLGFSIVLRNIIILHEKINQFVEKLGTLLSFPLFLQYACGCFTICNTILQVTILGLAIKAFVMVDESISFVLAVKQLYLIWSFLLKYQDPFKITYIFLLDEAREPGSMNTLGMCGYAGITFMQMATYHWLGNELLFKSDKIIEASYTSKWYQLDLASQKSLLVLMERAKRSLVVKVYGYISISLDSMGVIVRWAYSVFALIKARYG